MGLALAYYGSPHAPGGLAAGFNVGWFAPTYKLLDDAWRSAKRFFAPLATRTDGTQLRIEIGSASMEFWNISDGCGLGRKYGLVIVDEAAIAGDALASAWQQAIRPTLTDYRGGAWFFSTPRGMNFFHEVFRRGKAGDHPDWASYQAPSYDNPHLSPQEIDSARAELPELVFAQEYLAEFVTFGAGLVKPDMLLDGEAPPGLPVVLGVDLAISEREGADFTAIVALSRDPVSGLVYVREAERHRCGFNEVLQRIQAAAARWSPTLIAVEQVQYQAAVVQELTRTTRLPVRGVRPDRDKLTRFMPLLTRYEQCVAAGTLVETATGPVPIEHVIAGDLVWTRKGLRRVIWSGQTGVAGTVEINAGGRILVCTPEHPVYTETRGFVHAGLIDRNRDILAIWVSAPVSIVDLPLLVEGGAVCHVLQSTDGLQRESQSVRSLYSTASGIIYKAMDIGALVVTAAINYSTVLFGRLPTEQFQTNGTSIIKMETPAITIWKILKRFLRRDTRASLPRTQAETTAIARTRALSESGGGPIDRQSSVSATSAGKSLALPAHGRASALLPVTGAIGVSIVKPGSSHAVYNLEVDDCPEFFANGILVHNCQVRHDPARVPAWLRDELLAFPEGAHDDGVDALSLAFQAAACIAGMDLIATAGQTLPGRLGLIPAPSAPAADGWGGADSGLPTW